MCSELKGKTFDLWFRVRLSHVIDEKVLNIKNLKYIHHLFGI